jgi:transmembrane sensor
MKDGETGPGSDDAGDAAIEWLVRLRAEPLLPEEKQAFERWLACDSRNAEAFDEVLRIYGHLAGMDREPRRRPAVPGRRRRSLAAAAALAAATLALFAFFDELATRLRADHYAGAGERRLVALEDGSRVQLDSRTAIAVRYSAGERRLALLSGEAWFEVSPDPARPFVVEAGGGTVTALGTAFDVALEPSGARVTVTEHRVAVASGGASVVVEEGRQSRYERGGVAEPPEEVDVGKVTAWRRGKLIVSKQPLREVIAAIARYHRGFVYCVQPSVCERRVSGVFGADDALQSLREIEASLALRAIRLTDYMILLY